MKKNNNIVKLLKDMRQILIKNHYFLLIGCLRLAKSSLILND